MKQESDIIFESKEFPIIQIVARVLILAWIVFAVFMYSINPIFFGISILSALILFLLISEIKITSTNLYITIKHDNLLPFLSKRKDYYFKDIDEISIDKEKRTLATFALDLVFYRPGFFGKMPDNLCIKHKSEGWVDIPISHTTKEGKEFISLVNSKIYTVPNTT